jgi:tetrahydromethanopterin S-methyltransferase subunit G
MDEFCANKDAQLKRCACSARIHEFDGIKKKLGDVEKKMLDFNERLLAVSMDKEDAIAMSKASEGEQAYQQSDKSESQKILDTIMKKLESTTEETKQASSLAAITLSMDADVFDTIDPNLGAQTVAKEGEALYRDALPACVEMAAEICPADEPRPADTAPEDACPQS